MRATRAVAALAVGFIGMRIIGAVASATTVSPEAQGWRIPRTAAGHPDFQGATWNFATMTPLERAQGVDKDVFTEAEAAAFEKQTAERQTATTNNGYDWWDAGTRHLDRRRTSLIVDPPDGHLPALTAEAQRRVAIAGRPAGGPASGPEDFPFNTRCISWANVGPPMLPSPYNDNIQFIQTRDSIVISNENIHDARIVPIDGRPHGSGRRWLGDSRGRWDGDTLVIDTINFSDRVSVRGSDQNLRVIERFTRTDADTMEYRATVDDATVWTHPWTALLLMHRTDQKIYEFACHEGNFLSIKGLLEVARYQDKPR